MMSLCVVGSVCCDDSCSLKVEDLRSSGGTGLDSDVTASCKFGKNASLSRLVSIKGEPIVNN